MGTVNKVSSNVNHGAFLTSSRLISVGLGMIAGMAALLAIKVF